MRTPQQIAEYLKSQKDEDMALALTQREKYLKRLGKELSDILDGAMKRGEITEKGGEITYPNFNFLPSTRETDIGEIFRQAGWNCQYRPQTDSSYSAGLESMCSYTIHYFQLSPLGNKASADEKPAPPSAKERRARKRLAKNLDRVLEQVRANPLGEKEKETRQQALEKTLKPYRTPVTAENLYKTVD